MGKERSKDRPSRVRIAISDGLRGKAEPELPFRILAMGDYTLKSDDRAIYDRKPLNVDKSNFDAVMQQHNLSLELSVANRVSGEGEIPVSLRFGKLKDFRPEAIAQQIPELRNLLEIREGLRALRPELGKKGTQQKLLAALKDKETRNRILAMTTAPAGSGQSTAPAADAAPVSGSAPEEPASGDSAPDSGGEPAPGSDAPAS